MKNRFIIAICTTLVMASCSTPRNFNYLQDLTNGQQIEMKTNGIIKLQSGDEINITVKSKDPMMSSLFNKGLSTQLNSGVAGGTPYMTGYTIAPDGTIDFPVIDKIKLSGLTRHEAEQTLQQKLREDQLKDAIVTIEFKNLSYTVMGEVNRPGVYAISKDALTLTEALGQAGDLGVYGKRDSVMVVRTEGTKKKAYVLSMNSAKDLFTSEAYYIQQGDIIYVKANDVKARQSTANGNETRNISFWMSIVSVLTTVAILIFK